MYKSGKMFNLVQVLAASMRAVNKGQTLPIETNFLRVEGDALLLEVSRFIRKNHAFHPCRGKCSTLFNNINKAEGNFLCVGDDAFSLIQIRMNAL